MPVWHCIDKMNRLSKIRRALLTETISEKINKKTAYGTKSYFLPIHVIWLSSLQLSKYQEKKAYTSVELGMVSYGDHIKIGYSPGQWRPKEMAWFSLVINIRGITIYNGESYGTTLILIEDEVD